MRVSPMTHRTSDTSGSLSVELGPVEQVLILEVQRGCVNVGLLVRILAAERACLCIAGNLRTRCCQSHKNSSHESTRDIGCHIFSVGYVPPVQNLRGRWCVGRIRSKFPLFSNVALEWMK